MTYMCLNLVLRESNEGDFVANGVLPVWIGKDREIFLRSGV